MSSKLETQGFEIIPNLLNDELIEFLINNIQYQTFESDSQYHIKCASPLVLDKITPIISSAVSQVTENTNIFVDLIIPELMLIDNQTSPFEQYHQDFKFFYILQQNRNKLNFWIPLIKNNRTKSGLGVIPMDKLISMVPEYKDSIVNNGATRYMVNGATTEVNNFNKGTNYQLPINLDDIVVNPELSPGDALVLRGDTIHKTQDTDTHRLAISIRVTQGSAKINKNVFFGTNTVMQKHIDSMPHTIKIMQKLFDKSSEVTAYDFYKTLRE